MIMTAYVSCLWRVNSEAYLGGQYQSASRFDSSLLLNEVDFLFLFLLFPS